MPSCGYPCRPSILVLYGYGNFLQCFPWLNLPWNLKLLCEDCACFCETCLCGHSVSNQWPARFGLVRDAFSRTPMSPALLAAMARSLECGSSVVSIQQQEQQPCSGRKSAVAFFERFENLGQAILRRLALLNMITLNFFIWSLLISLGNHSALLLCHGLSLHSAYAHGEVGILTSKPSHEKYSTIDCIYICIIFQPTLRETTK